MLNYNFYQTGGIPTLFSSDSSNKQIFEWAQENTSFKNKKTEVYYLPNPEATGSILVGLDSDADFTLDDLRFLGYKIYNTAIENNISELEIKMPQINEMCNRQVMLTLAEGMLQATYKFDRYLTKKDNQLKADLTVNYTPEHGPLEKMQEGYNRLKNIMTGVFLARDLVNQTSNYIYPETLAQSAKEKLEPLGVKVKVYDLEQITEIGMKAFLEVAKGSAREPRLIVMKYQGDPDSKDFTGLVGKGVTYDSGGYSLKPSTGMADMHCDMGGAGTVIGTMYALAKTKAKANVYGVVAACENLVSGTSFKVGDVISSLSGKSIEVDNTDAEGRLTLADAIFYTTENLKVSQVIDLATLTGACLVALGEEYTGALTNDQDFYALFEKAAREAGEKVWLFPNDQKIAEYNKSKVADIKNTGGRLAGTITAGQFVGEFVANNIPWIHLDIAGTAYLSKANQYLPERATGVHVKSLINLLEPIDQCKTD